MKMIRGVIFDLGNTLLHFDGDWNQVLQSGVENMCAYLTGRGYPVPISFGENFRALREAGRKRVLTTDREYTAENALNDTLTQHSICWIPDAVIPRAVEKYFDAEAAHWVPYPDARDTLEILRGRGLKLALMSNATDHAFIERIARNANLFEFFDPLVSSAGNTFRKPDPRAFETILNAWQIPANEIVMVGDAASYDILGAHRAGMRGVLIEDRWDPPLAPHGEFADGVLMQPDARIRQLSELPGVIERMGNEETGK